MYFLKLHTHNPSSNSVLKKDSYHQPLLQQWASSLQGTEGLSIWGYLAPEDDKQDSENLLSR